MEFAQIKGRMESEIGLVTQERVGGRDVIAGYTRHGFQMPSSVIQLDINFIAFNFGREPATLASTEQCLAAAVQFALRRHRQFYPRWYDFGRLIPVGIVSLIVSSAPQAHAVSYCVDLKCQKVWLRPKVPVIVDASVCEFHVFQRSPRRGSLYYNYLREMVAKVTQCAPGGTSALA